MSLRKYRADIAGETQSDGSVPWFAKWIGGNTLALIRKCQTPNGTRTVYATSHPDTFFSIPAAYEFKKKRYTGFITVKDKEYVFCQHTDQR